MAKLKAVLRAVTGIDLAAMDQEIGRLESELGKLKVTREALGKLQAMLGNGNAADPTAVRRTIVERAAAFLTDKAEGTVSQIAAAIGAERAAVYTAMHKRPETFRQKDGMWRLK